MRRKLQDIPKIETAKYGGDFIKARRAWMGSITEEEADFLWKLADERIARAKKRREGAANHGARNA